MSVASPYFYANYLKYSKSKCYEDFDWQCHNRTTETFFLIAVNRYPLNEQDRIKICGYRSDTSCYQKKFPLYNICTANHEFYNSYSLDIPIDLHKLCNNDWSHYQLVFIFIM